MSQLQTAFEVGACAGLQRFGLEKVTFTKEAYTPAAAGGPGLGAFLGNQWKGIKSLGSNLVGGFGGGQNPEVMKGLAAGISGPAANAAHRGAAMEDLMTILPTLGAAGGAGYLAYKNHEDKQQPQMMPPGY